MFLSVSLITFNKEDLLLFCCNFNAIVIYKTNETIVGVIIVTTFFYFFYQY